MQQPVRAARDDVLLNQHLQPIGQRLQQPIDPHAGGSEPVLHPRDQFAFEPGEIHHDGRCHGRDHPHPHADRCPGPEGLWDDAEERLVRVHEQLVE